MINAEKLKRGDTIWVLVHDYHDGYHNHFKPTKARFVRVVGTDDNPLHDRIDYSYASNGKRDWASVDWCFRTKKEASEYNKQREIEISTEEETK